MMEVLKVAYISGREPSYTRCAVLLRGLRLNEVDVVESTSNAKWYLLRYPEALFKYLIRHRPEITFVGFFGQPLMIILRSFSRKPIIFDAYISAYDTLCLERGTFQPNSFLGKSIYTLDRKSCELADIVLLDTQAHIDYFVDSFSLDRSNFKRLFVGADDSIFHPMHNGRSRKNNYRILYYGTFRPLQGVEYVVKAAKRLKDYNDIRFTIIGTGITKPKVMQLSRRIGVSNVQFIDWLPPRELAREITRADLCLGGHFSTIPKATRVIASKTYEIIAMKRPVIVGDCAANRELFRNKHNAYLCEMGDDAALADAILDLYDDEQLRWSIAEEGYRTFQAHCSPRVLGAQLRILISSLMENLR